MKHSIFLFAFIIVISMSCREMPTPVVGDVTGRVIPFDVSGDSIPSALAGITVWIQGTSFSAVTDSTGQYTLKNVPPAINTIFFTRPGFDTTYIPQVVCHGAGVDFVPTASIIRIPTDSIVLDYFEARDTITTTVGYTTKSKYIVYGGHTSSTTLEGYYVVCSLDSAGAGTLAYNGNVQNGKFSGVIWDLGSTQQVPITSGLTIHAYPEAIPVLYIGNAAYQFPCSTYGFGPRKFGSAMAVTVP